MSPARRTLVIATGNRHKVEEIADILAASALHLLCLADLPAVEEAVEDADSFAGNARKKAIHYALATGYPCLADDSGICVDALEGAPGIHSARYAGGAGDDANNRLLLDNLAGVPAESRGAEFRCALCLALPDGSIAVEVEGQVRGRLLDETRGTEGFGYDPLFVPEGHRLSFGQLPPEIKRGISHRTAALRLLRPHLERVFGPPA
jgi:XTP/dITP diphosphohydrolase